jgi:hypothetical protein
MELTGYWSKHPPTHILIGAYLGIGTEDTKRIEDCTEVEMMEFAGMVNGIGVGNG